VDVVFDFENELVNTLFIGVFNGTLRDVVSSNLPWEACEKLFLLLSVVQIELHVSELVVEGDGLHDWECCLRVEELFGNELFAISKFVTNPNRELIVLEHFEVRDLEARREHGGLETCSASDDFR